MSRSVRGILKRGFVLNGMLSMFLGLGHANAQRVAADVDPLREYSVGLELFQKQKYAAAQERFSKALGHPRSLPSVQRENAVYYNAAAALELFNGDGQWLMESFVASYPEHSMINMANFQLGTFHFTKKRYKNVLEQFELVDESKLEQQYLEEFYFKKGYSHFQQEEYDRSKEALSHVLKGGKKYRSPAVYYHSYILYREQMNESALAGFKELETDKLFGNVVPFYILQIYYRQGKNEEVISYGKQLLNKDFAKSKTGEIHRMLGEAYYNLGQYKEAVPEMELAISELGGNRDDRYKLAYAAYRGGEFEKAIGYFKQVATDEDELTQLAHYHMGDCFLKSGNKMEARSSFRSASRFAFDPEIQEDALFNFAKTAYELSYDPYNEAVQAFEEYIAKNPNSHRADEAYQFLLQVYLTTHNYEAAIASIDKMKKVNDGLKATYQRICYVRGTELFQDLEFESSIQFFKRSDKYPVSSKITARSIFWQAEAYARSKRTKSAEEHYRLFMEVPGAIGLPEFGLAHYGMAYACFEGQRLEEAISWFRKFVDYEKSDSLRVNDGLLRIADAYYLQKNTPRAIEFYDKAIQYDKFDVDYAIFQIAVCYGLEGKTGSKLETLKTMLKNHPKTGFAADAKYEIAETYFFSDNSSEAINYFDKVISEHPNSNYVPKAKLKKGLLYYNASSDELALPILKDVAENYPATEEAKEALMKVQKIYVEEGDVPGFENYLSAHNFPDITTGALDTSYYESAEFMYMKGNLENAMKEFGTYLVKFPNGYFKLNANFYRAEAAVKLKDYDQALIGFDNVLNFKTNVFTERSLISASQIYFYQKRFSEALAKFLVLEEVAESAENLIEARAGIMRCNFELGKFDASHEYALKIQRSDKAPEELVHESLLVSARCAMAQNDLKMAEERFEQTLLASNSVIGAEALYSLAKIHFLRGEYDRSEKLIFDMVSVFPNYGEWISRSFLLLADNYIMRDDLFQARLTLQNVIDNYDGELKAEAERKMAELNEMTPKLEERKDGDGWEIEFEQEGKVRDDIFELDEDEVKELDVIEE